jgi:reductive dehalogenase
MAKEKRKKPLENENESASFNRRDFLKLGAVTTAVGAAASVSIASSQDDEPVKPKVTTHDSFPHEIKASYDGHDQWETVHHQGFFGRQLMAGGVDVDPKVLSDGDQFIQINNYEWDNEKKGKDQLSKAVFAGAWAQNNDGVGPSAGAIPDFGLNSWAQNETKDPRVLMGHNFIAREKFKFESKKQASDAIKRAAQLYGASMVGIAANNPKWNYKKFFNYIPPIGRTLSPELPPSTVAAQIFSDPKKAEEILKHPMVPMMVGSHPKAAGVDFATITPEEAAKLFSDRDIAGALLTIPDIFMDISSMVLPKLLEDTANYMGDPSQWFYGWEKFPFEPKSVIVLVYEMDYEAMSSSPADIASAAVGEGYSQMSKVGNQVATMIKQLGFHAVAAGNDMAMSVPYAIEAGLGEGSRMGLLVTYPYGPRVRISKVFTDLELDYDKPTTFGVMDFCKNCNLCTEACPNEAIPKQKEQTFENTFEPGAFYSNEGVKKYYGNAKKCFEQWVKGKGDCTICICSCPYNKPDFWHHRLVEKVNRAMPGPVHGLMREMDKLFGYGNRDDKKAVDKFFENRKDRKYNGGL